MKLKKFKEKNLKKIGIILFTISCILLISGVILYRTFAIFQVDTNQNMIEGTVQDVGDVEFAFYINDTISKTVPENNGEYSLDTSSSKCIEVTTGKQISNVSWDDENWEVRLKNISTTKTKCYLYFKKIYKEDTLNGAIPDLGNGRLIPITILSNEAPTDNPYVGGHSGKVEKADITESWYSYKDKQWANAVILRDGVVDTYQPGDEIKESDIESYFVWIPRYRYQLKENETTYNGYITAETIGQITDVNDFYKIHENKATNNTFDIIFETKNDGIKTGSTKNTYITHPAFASFDSNGFWVGKFETGYDGATNTKEAEINEQQVEKVIIKPNVYSWRSIQTANAFYTSYYYQRELESHLMKNTEWGAVAYLTHSKYGRCNNENKNCEEVKINNNFNYITGYSAINDPNTKSTTEIDNTSLNQDGSNGYNYYNFDSQVASTTGNYYGIYDMSGGAWDLVMGVMHYNESNSSPTSGKDKDNNSGFNGFYTNEEGEKKDGLSWPSSKYYDLYDFNKTDAQYHKGILGDATKEIGPFYIVDATRVSSYNADRAAPLTIYQPWIYRGGACYAGFSSGIFAFGPGTGAAAAAWAFRIILSP